MQIIREITTSMLNDVDAKRNWVKGYYTPESINEYETIVGKLSLLEVILSSNWIETTEKLKLQCLGVTFGDVFVQDMGFIWVQVEDEMGIDPALLLPGTSIKLFPLTMISKRIEQGEKVDIVKLYKQIKSYVGEIKAKT